MATRKQWGALCPTDGGILLSNPDWGDKLWCPSNRHGGNGMFYLASTTTEGWGQMTTGSGLTESQIRALRGDSEGDVVTAEEKPKRKRSAAGKSTKDGVVRAARVVREPKACECGCEGLTKGGRFLPGHDARLHSRQNAEAKAAGFDTWAAFQASLTAVPVEA